MQKKKSRVIKLRNIRPELRLFGGIFRTFMPECSTVKMLQQQNRFTDRFMTDRWFGKHTKIETKYITRKEYI